MVRSSHGSESLPFSAESSSSASPGSTSLLKADDMAKLLKISVRTLWRLVSSGRVIAPIRLTGNTRWQRDQVEKWINAGCPAVSFRKQ